MERVEELIEEGLRHFGLPHDPASVGSLSAYVGELDRWNSRMNLVGFKSREPIVVHLLYDAFFLSARAAGAASLLDLGSGSGVVSVPMAVLNPGMTVFSLEKSLKKVLFQRHVKRLLSLPGLSIVHGRAEETSPLGVDVLVAKAFGPTEAVLARGGRHLVQGGRAFIVKGGKAKLSAYAGFIPERAEAYSLPGTDRAYQLFVYKKIS